MKSKRLLFPLAAVVVAVIAVSATAGLISAAYYAPTVLEQTKETEGTPQEPEPEPTPTAVPKTVLELSEVKVENALLTEDPVRGYGQEVLPSGDGEGGVYTWEDGDRTMRVVLQNDLVVQDNTAINSKDEVIRRGAKQSIVRKDSLPVRNGGPVFRSESGGGLMTLSGGVLLALDPEWDQEKVEAFFEDNGISLEGTTVLDFLKNGFLIETLPGFPSLEQANALAGQDGVIASSPNWAREVELK